VIQPLSGLGKLNLLPRHCEYDELGTLAQELVQSPRLCWKTRRL
jgi:hypothetical protein